MGGESSQPLRFKKRLPMAGDQNIGHLNQPSTAFPGNFWVIKVSIEFPDISRLKPGKVDNGVSANSHFDLSLLVRPEKGTLPLGVAGSMHNPCMGQDVIPILKRSELFFAWTV